MALRHEQRIKIGRFLLFPYGNHEIWIEDESGDGFVFKELNVEEAIEGIFQEEKCS